MSTFIRWGATCGSACVVVKIEENSYGSQKQRDLSRNLPA